MLLNVASVVDKRWKARALLFISKESASYPGRVSLLRYQKPRWKILENLRFFTINMNIDILTIKLKNKQKNFIMQYYSSDFHYNYYFVVIVHCSYSFSVIVFEIMQGSGQKKLLINLHNIYIREHVWNVGIYLLICMQLFNNHF